MDFHLQHTPIDDIPAIHASLKATFRSSITRDLTYRKTQLLQLARLVQDNEQLFYDALHIDLHKPVQEVAIQELAPVINGAIRAAKSLDEWAKPDCPKVDDWKVPLQPKVLKVPKGVALIIAPWNYPVILCLQPLIGAVAAGCPAVVKPSELAPRVAQLLADLFPKYLDPSAYVIVNGAVPETTAVLQLPWDHIFYTGNGRVGRIVSQAAAKHLTPCTLELGGQSPVVIDETADLKLAAKRVLFGKLQNAGQLCVSPNHVFVLRSKQEEFVQAMKEVYKQFWPNGPFAHPGTFARIVTPSHFNRIEDYLNRTEGSTVIGGGKEPGRGLELTIVKDVSFSDSMLQEELFGPLLAVVPVASIDEAIEWINDHGHPLAMYVFTEDENTKSKFINMTSSGSLIFNDTVGQLAVYEIPFGGHGASGYGYQHGIYTFNMFTHFRSSIDVPKELEDFLSFRYPPYTDHAKQFADMSVKVPIPTVESLNG